MIIEAIKDRIETELLVFMDELDREHFLSKTSPFLFRIIREFTLRKGKRIRPILFLPGYLGFADRAAENLYHCALSIELLHNFTLVHDDIIDKSLFQRGKPSMYAYLTEYLKKRRRIKFNVKDMAPASGDVMYALALSAFLTINECWDRKEKAFKRLIRSAVSTGSGEFMEILCGTTGLERMKKTEICKIYELKTADYTFAIPLVTGAILAGADEKETGRLLRFGKNAGIAFQIKDDLLDILDAERVGRRDPFIEVQEAN
ncbi:MAG: polyprenyl synthetase family protein [Candidatus Omnitrophota bacterium]